MPAIPSIARSAKRCLFIGLYPFTMLCTAPIALMLILAYSGIADDLFGIQDMAENVRQESLPAILRVQRTLSDINNLRQHAECIMTTDDPALRRRSRIMAHAITSRGMLGDDPELARNCLELGEPIRELAEIRNREDHARARLHAAASRLTGAVDTLSDFLDAAEGERMRRLLFVDPAEKTDTGSFRPLVENRFRQFTPLMRLCAASTSSQNPVPADAQAPDSDIAPLCDAFFSSMKDMETAWEERKQTQRTARHLWSRLNVLLRKTGNMAGKAETRNIERTMKTISLDAEEINHFFHRAFICLILLFCFLLFMLHRYMLSPIALAGAQLREIRNGTFREPEKKDSPSPCIRIQELAELFSFLPELRGHLAALDVRSTTLEREKEHYEELSLRDGLTGAFNRRCLDQRLALKDEATPLAALMVDVDFFKYYNDTYGHPAGDACLINIVRELKSALRSTDGVYRYGGEEFIVLLSDASTSEAFHVAEILRKRVHKLALPHESSPADAVVTVSIGVAARGPNCPLSGEELVKRADEALYQAKAAGRNRSQAYKPQL